MENVVATEVAQAEFERFMEAMDLQHKLEGKLDADDLKSFDDAKRTIISAMERGKLMVDSDGQPVLITTASSEAVTFYEPTGADLMAMDQAKKGHDQEKLAKVMAAITRKSPGFFSKLPMRDHRVCTAITSLFLG